MIVRRFLIYFLVVAAVAVGATAAFEVYSLRRAAQQAVDHHMATARTVAGFVREGLVDYEAKVLAELLDELPQRVVDDASTRAMIRSARRKSLDGAGIALIDSRRRVVTADLGRSGLPPTQVFLAAVRHAEERMVPVVTDLWWGRNGAPHVALVVGDTKGGQWRAALAPMNLEGEDFNRLFRVFVTDENSRLQLLDSRGTALFSTYEKERYRSVVHGTYFSDRVRLGEPAVMQCHSCHLEKDREEVLEEEVTVVAPVPGTDWSVSVREGRNALFAPLREVAYSSVALASVIIGTFAAFFVLLARGVLRPIRQLVRVAARISRGDQVPALPTFDVDDEFATLAQSLETLRHHAVHGSSGRIRVEPLARGGMSLDLAGDGSPRTDGEICETLESTVEPILAGLVRIQAIRSAMLLMSCPGGVRKVVRPKGSALDLVEGLEKKLLEVGEGRSSATPRELEELEVKIPSGPDTWRFSVRRIRVLEGIHGQLWVGLAQGAEGISSYLTPALDLVATHLEHLLVRNLLYDQLRSEHEQKNRMVRHLFEADDEERRRIARELHDETAQILNALLVQLETFPPAGDAEAQEERLERAKACVSQLIDEMDRLIRRLRPAVLDDLGLVEAVRTTGLNLLSSTGVEFELHVEGEGDADLPREMEAAVYRVFQEAITNVLKHARARHVRASIEFYPDLLVASIEDDGQGMDLSWVKNAAERPRWGLMGIRERVLQFGGKIHFSTPESGGVRIDFEVPIAQGGAVLAEA